MEKQLEFPFMQTRRDDWAASLIRITFLVLVGMIAVMSFAVLGGCAQNTEAPLKQTVAEAVSPESRQEQDTVADQGAKITLNIQNDVAGGDNSCPIDCETNGIPQLADAGSDGTGNRVAGARGHGLKNQNVTVNVSTGSVGITPTATGSATGTGSVAANPNSTVSPFQDIKPRTGIDVPVAIAPAGQANATGNANAGESGGDTSSSTDQRLQRLEANNQRNAEVLKALVDLLTPASQPVDASTSATGD